MTGARLVVINSDTLERLRQTALDLHRHGRGLAAAAKRIEAIERDDGDAGQAKEKQDGNEPGL